MQKFLIIQTAFIGDVVLATAMIEKLFAYFPDAQIDFLVKKGNESLLYNNPHVHEIIIWDKKKDKYKNYFSILKQIRKTKYDKVVTPHRFATSGLLTVLSGATQTIGFDKNPFSFLFSKKIKHIISSSSPGKHEVERNNDLIKDFTDDTLSKPKLYPSAEDYEKVKTYICEKYVTMSPSSVWFTKQYPVEKWIELINKFQTDYKIYLLGGKDNFQQAENIILKSENKQVENLCGKLNFLQSAELMKHAAMNYVNDSAPLHFASAVNAPVTAIFCSTLPTYGFGPLSDTSIIVEIDYSLSCRPCGLHGKKDCPQSHFKCGYDIETGKLLKDFR